LRTVQVKKLRRPYLKNKLGVVVHICNLAIWGMEKRGPWSEFGQGKSMRPYLESKLKAKGLEWHSPSKHGVLISNPSTPLPKKHIV
jgi:hypothetical protein